MSQELQKFEPLKAEIAKFVAPALGIKVTDFKSSADAVEAAKVIKAIQNRVTELRRAIVDPLNDRVKEVNSYAKQIMSPLDQVEAHVRSELNRFAEEQERIRQAELRKAEEERLRKEAELRERQEAERQALESGMSLFGDGLEPEEIQKIEEKQETERALLNMEAKQAVWDLNQFQVKNTRRTAKVKILDITQVPKDFLIIQVNEKAALAAMKAGVKIPGLELYHEVGVAIGEKTRVTKTALGVR